MTAVICWSMKMRMVAKMAGMMAAAMVQLPFFHGLITQPRSAAFVGSNLNGTSNFGVGREMDQSNRTKVTMAMMTAKSESNTRTRVGKKLVFLGWEVKRR